LYEGVKQQESRSDEEFAGFLSLQKETRSDEEFTRPMWQAISHRESSDGFQELPEGEEANLATTLPNDQTANWCASSLFAPVQLPNLQRLDQNPVDVAHKGQSVCMQASVDVPPQRSPNLYSSGAFMYNGGMHGMMPEQGGGMNMMFPQSISQGHAVNQGHAAMHAGMPHQQPPLTGGSSGNATLNSRVGLPTDFPAAYPIRPSFSDEPVYADGLPMADQMPAYLMHAGNAPQYDWSGMGSFRNYGRVSLGCQSGTATAQSNSAFGSESDPFPGVGWAHAEFGAVPEVGNQNPGMQPGGIDRSHSQGHVSTGMGLHSGATAGPVRFHLEIMDASITETFTGFQTCDHCEC
jgi:hypothetical protein